MNARSEPGPRPIIAAVLAIICPSCVAAGMTDPNPLESGNARLLAGDAAGALAAYGNVDTQTPGPLRDRLRLARATAALASGDPGMVAEAVATLEELTADRTVDATALHAANANLGAARLVIAEAIVQADPGRAAELFAAAAASYLAAYRLDPSDLDAARNVEHARIRSAEIRRAEAERQERAQQAQQAADRLDELAQRQRDQADQTADQGPTQEGLDRQRELSEEAQRLLDALEARRDDPGDQPREPQDQPSTADQFEQAREALERARDAQREAEERLASDESEATAQAAEAQRRAAESLAEAADRMRDAARQQGQGDQQGQPQEQQGSQNGQDTRPADGAPGQESEGMAEPPDAGAETGDPSEQPVEARPEGDPLVERLLDRERRQRESRVQSRPGRPVRVERDW